MKKIHVEGLGTAYLPEFSHENVMYPDIGRYYVKIEVWKIRDAETKKIFYSTDIADREEHGELMDALVSRRTLKKAGGQ